MTFAYPIWYLILCAALGLSYAGALYFKDRNLNELPKALLPFFAFLRFLSISTIALFLLEPVLNYKQTDTEKPIILFAADNSTSLTQVAGEESMIQWNQDWKLMQEELDKDFEVRAFRFGETLNEQEGIPAFDAKSTNISGALQSLYDLYANRNVGAVILATDGIYNAGSNPGYSRSQLAAPVYTIGLGDTSIQKDIRIDRTYANRIVYLDDRFTIRVDVSGLRAAGARTTLKVDKIESGRATKLSSQSLNIDRDFYDDVKEFVVTADKAGVLHLRFSLSEIEGEVSTANNYTDLFIDVLDARQNVLLLAHSPHPDITALRQVLSENSNYEIDYALASNFTGAVNNYDLAVLHQLPSSKYPIEPLIASLRKEGVPVLFILGSQTNISTFNKIQSILKITGANNSVNEVQAKVNNNFGLFNLEDGLKGELRRYPPLKSPFGQYQVSPEARVLLQQQIGSVSTDYPLFAFSESGAQREGILTAEGIWRWRLHDWFEHGNHNQFEELISKSLQYLSVKSDRRTFKTLLTQNIFTENEQVIIQAELYNDSYEPINTPDVALEIKNEEGQVFDFRFNRKGNAYFLNAGSLPPSDYSYTATTVWDQQTQQHSGKFTVSPVQLEAIQVTANHGILNEISASSGGSYFHSSAMVQLTDQIKANNEIRPVLHETVRSRSLLHIKAIFFGLLILLSLEWFLRKFNGGY